MWLQRLNGIEKWTLAKRAEELLTMFEEKMLGRIHSPERENCGWRIRHNYELSKLCKDLVVVKLPRTECLTEYCKVNPGHPPKQKKTVNTMAGYCGNECTEDAEREEVACSCKR